jgi:septal ring factor EnvC (AmiA/AmiB activator)
MTTEILAQNWALVVASVLSLAIFLFVMFRLYEDSSHGRLGQSVRELNAVKKEASKAKSRLSKAKARFEELRKKADQVKPRLLTEAEEAVKDADLLVNITGDQLMRAEKILRDVILEDFPPNRQDVLRSRYL